MNTVFDTGLPASDTLTLPRCDHCGHVSYPPRELCGNCLADALAWRPVDGHGVVQSRVELHYSLEPQYSRHLPWPVASVRLDCGPVVLAHLQPGVETGAGVTLRVVRDSAGNHMLVAAGDDPATGQALPAWLDSVDFKEVSP